MSAPEAPECERMKEVAPLSNEIGEFLDWLGYEKGWHLGEYDPDSLSGRMYPVQQPFEKILAEYFEIDLNKVEDERRAILEYIREQG